jgi:hypothetical protein
MANISYKVTDELIHRLRKIYDDQEFVLAILTYADNDIDRQKIIDFIDAGIDVDDETVSVLAIELDNNHDSQKRCK